MPEKSLTISGKKHFISIKIFMMWKRHRNLMKSLPFEMIALHIQAELSSLLGAPEHTLQHFWVVVCTAAEMCSRRCYKSLIFTLFI